MAKTDKKTDIQSITSDKKRGKQPTRSPDTSPVSDYSALLIKCIEEIADKCIELGEENNTSGDVVQSSNTDEGALKTKFTEFLKKENKTEVEKKDIAKILMEHPIKIKKQIGEKSKGNLAIFAEEIVDFINNFDMDDSNKLQIKHKVQEQLLKIIFKQIELLRGARSKEEKDQLQKLITELGKKLIEGKVSSLQKTIEEAFKLRDASSVQKAGSLSDDQQLSESQAILLLLQDKIKTISAYRDVSMGTMYRLWKTNNLKKQTLHFSELIKTISKNNIEQVNSSFAIDQHLDKDNYKLVYDFFDKVTWTARHSTEAYFAIKQSGILAGTAEVSRLGKEVSGFSTTAVNTTPLGNSDFVFFRISIGDEDTEQTRYGSTCLVFDLKELVEYGGWVSLHDQSRPFESETTKMIKENDGASLRIIPVSGGESYTSWQQTYPQNQEKQEMDSDNNPVSIQVSFTDEIFYGKDIIPGIINYLIRELNRIGNSTLAAQQYKQKIFSQIRTFNEKQNTLESLKIYNEEEFNLQMHKLQVEKDQFASNILKTFMRPEFKFPVAVNLNLIPIKKVYNPIGCGDYLPDGSKSKTNGVVGDLREAERKLRSLGTDMKLKVLTNPKSLIRNFQNYLKEYQNCLLIIIKQYKTFLNGLKTPLYDDNDIKEARKKAIEYLQKLQSDAKKRRDLIMEAAKNNKNKSIAIDMDTQIKGFNTAIIVSIDSILTELTKEKKLTRTTGEKKKKSK